MIRTYYTQTITRKRFTSGSTGWGSDGTWSSISVDAAVNKTRGDERYTADRKAVYADFKLFMSSTVDIQAGDLVEWGGYSLDVIEVKNTLQLGHHKRVITRINQKQQAST